MCTAAQRFSGVLLLSFVITVWLGGCANNQRRVVLQKTSTEMALAQYEAAQAAAQPPAPAWNTRPPGEIAPGFEIEVRSGQDSSISGSYKVAADGTLSLPYDVKVSAAGATLEQLRDRVRDSYRRFLVSPDVNVEVVKKEYFLEVRGLVTKPGQYLVRGDASLDEIAALAGGTVQNADPNAAPQFAVIQQLGVTNSVKLREYYAGNRAQIPQWQGGEVIYFQVEPGPSSAPINNRAFVQFLGEVKRPGEFPFQPNSDFFDYLIKAGGPTERANLDTVALLRNIEGQREIITFNPGEPESIPPLSPGDTLVFNPDSPSRLEKDTRVAGGFASVLSALTSVLLLLAL